MLLTLKPPNQNDFKSPHDYPSLNNSSSRYSPPPTIASAGSFSETFDSRMSNPHRGLPPPAAMTLPPPSSNLPAMAPLGQLPAPPSQWAGAEESMRNWLLAKVEEDRRKQEEERRKQEEEKTKQETVKLDQSRVYHNMLRESLQGGIPPVMVPLIFAGMGGGNLSNQSLEWAQHYMAQMSQQQQQQQQIQAQQQQQQQQQQHSLPPDDIRRDNRMVPPIVYPSHQQIQPAITAAAGQMPPQTTQTSFGRQVALQKTASSGNLSRLNTNEMQIQKPPTGPLPFAQGGDTLQASQPESREQSSPVIYFHHWVPPTKDTANPSTPSTKSQHNSPYSQNAASHLRSEHQNSPKKRKATGGHQAPPAPSNPSESSPLFSQASSRDRESPPNHQPNHQRGRRRDSGQGSDGPSTRGFDGQPIARPSRQGRPDQVGDDSVRSNRQVGESMSGDERRMRIRAAESETGQSRYQADKPAR